MTPELVLMLLRALCLAGLALLGIAAFLAEQRKIARGVDTGEHRRTGRSP